MAYFPFFIEIQDKKCCVLGGGEVAFRKVEALLEFGADITVISPHICEEILLIRDRISIQQRSYCEQDIEDACYVIAATDDNIINSSIYRACKDRNILVNVVDRLEECSFLFPSYVKKGNVTIGITTSGKSPFLAGQMKKMIQNVLPDYIEEFVDCLGEYRNQIKKRVPSGKVRAAIIKELTYLGLENKGIVTQEDLDNLLSKYRDISNI